MLSDSCKGPSCTIKIFYICDEDNYVSFIQCLPVNILHRAGPQSVHQLAEEGAILEHRLEISLHIVPTLL